CAARLCLRSRPHSLLCRHLAMCLPVWRCALAFPLLRVLELLFVMLTESALHLASRELRAIRYSLVSAYCDDRVMGVGVVDEALCVFPCERCARNLVDRLRAPIPSVEAGRSEVARLSLRGARMRALTPRWGVRGVLRLGWARLG